MAAHAKTILEDLLREAKTSESKVTQGLAHCFGYGAPPALAHRLAKEFKQTKAIEIDKDSLYFCLGHARGADLIPFNYWQIFYAFALDDKKYWRGPVTDHQYMNYLYEALEKVTKEWEALGRPSNAEEWFALKYPPEDAPMATSPEADYME